MIYYSRDGTPPIMSEFGVHNGSSASSLEGVRLNTTGSVRTPLHQLIQGNSNGATNDQAIIALLGKAKDLHQFVLVETICTYLRKELSAMPGISINGKCGFEMPKALCEALEPCVREQDVRDTIVKLLRILVSFKTGICIIKYVMAQVQVQYGVLLENSLPYSLDSSQNPATFAKDEVKLHSDSRRPISDAEHVSPKQPKSIGSNQPFCDAQSTRDDGQQFMKLKLGTQVYFHANREQNEALDTTKLCTVVSLGSNALQGQSLVFGPIFGPVGTSGPGGGKLGS